MDATEYRFFLKTLRNRRVQRLSEGRAKVQVKDEQGRFLERNPGQKCLDCGQFLRGCYCGEPDAVSV